MSITEASDLYKRASTEYLGSSSFLPYDDAVMVASAASARRRYLAHLVSLEYWWSIGGFLGVLAIMHAAHRISTWIALQSSKAKQSNDAEKGPSGPTPRSNAFLCRIWWSLRSITNIVLFRWPLPFQKLHNLGNIAEWLCVGAYIGGTLGWTFMGTPDINIPTNWSGRAGMMAAVQIPFIVALGGKNNLISFITGLSHEKLNVVHRAAGRILLVVGWIHVGGKLWGFIKVYKEPPFDDVENRWGLAAIIALTLAASLSIRPFRNRFYEYFLMTHVIFIFAFILSVLQHKPEMQTYVYPGFIFWALDRLLRLGRLSSINLLSSPHPSGTVVSTSTIECISRDTVRLSVKRSRNIASSWKAGQHFFLIAPGISTLPWEAHPFTPATIADESNSLSDSSSDRNVQLDFIIRGRDGFTAKLLRRASLKEGAQPVSSMVLVDGPYGHPPELGVFDTAILIAGGSGVSYTLSMLLDRIHQAQKGKGRTSRVLFIWIIRDNEHVNWITPALQAAVSSSTNEQHPLDLDLRIFVTQGSSKGVPTLEMEEQNQPPSPASEDNKEMKEETDKTAFPDRSTASLADLVHIGGGRMQVVSGRPDIRGLIDEELAASDGLNVSVDVSGPSGLAASVRKVLATSKLSSPSAALRGGPSVTLHTETFGW